MGGFTYIEILVATTLLVVSLVPALDALSVGVRGATVHRTDTVDRYYLSARLEALLAEAYSALDAEALRVNNPATPTAYSDTVTTADGRTLVRQVFLSRYDADNADNDNNFFTGTDAGLLWIRVELQGTGMRLESLTSAYQ
jgi:type II secretory pathway pseudopilin PulG